MGDLRGGKNAESVRRSAKSIADLTGIALPVNRACPLKAQVPAAPPRRRKAKFAKVVLNGATFCFNACVSFSRKFFVTQKIFGSPMGVYFMGSIGGRGYSVIARALCARGNPEDAILGVFFQFDAVRKI